MANTYTQIHIQAIFAVKSQASRVIAYVQNQEGHHRKITFLEEYKKLLEKFEVVMTSDIFLKR